MFWCMFIYLEIMVSFFFSFFSCFQEASSLPDQLGEATNYIKKMQIKLEKLKERRDFTNGTRLSSDTDTASAGLRLPHIDIQERGSALEVVLITKSDCQFMFTETIRLLHEEGAEVVNASFSVLDETIFHTVHSKVTTSLLSFHAFFCHI